MHTHGRPVTSAAVSNPFAFGDAMRRARRQQGLSQRGLAKLVAVNSETINRVERGEPTRPDTINKIRRGLPNLVVYTDPLIDHGIAPTRAVLPIFTPLAEIRDRIQHIVQTLDSLKALQRIQALALDALNKQVAEQTRQGLRAYAVHTPVTRKREKK